MAAPQEYPSRLTAHRLLDAHLHVWAPADQTEFPFAGALLGAATDAKQPPMPGHVEVALEAMHAAGVSGGLIVQPGNHLYDHSYVQSVLARHPQQFVGCLLANPTIGKEAGLAEMERLIAAGFKAVRFNPTLWPGGALMDDEVGCALYERAGELKCPVGHMPFDGFLKHLPAIEALLKAYPDTVCILDHFGFCGVKDGPEGEAWQQLLRLAKYPQLYVKASAFFRVSSQAWPHKDVQPCLRALLDAFGNRVMLGTDFPWVTEKGGYTEAWTLIDEWGQDTLLSPEERTALFGGTLASLFPDLSLQPPESA